MTHYELLMRMGRAPIPVEMPSSYIPSYIGYSPCLPNFMPPPEGVVCSKHASSLSDDELETLLTGYFFVTYPELLSITNAQKRALVLAKQLRCRFPSLACLDTDCSTDRFFLLLAHYLATPDDEDGNGNAVSSAHVGDTSVSYDTSTTQRLPWFFLQLSKTRYGRELITLLDNATGIVVV